VLAKLREDARLSGKRRFSALLFAVLTALCLLAVPRTAEAFDDSRYDVLRQQRLFTSAPPRPVRPTYAPARPVPHYAPRKRETPAALPLPASNDMLAPEDTAPKATRYVTVFGDSLGLQLGQGLRAAFATTPELVITNKARADTGLVNTSNRDWVKFVRETLEGPDKINMAIMMIGSNDGQPLRDEANQIVEPLSEGWKAIYARRIDDIIAAVKQKGVPLVWVGLPIMKSETLNARMLAFNDIYRERAQRAGMTYIDLWEAFSDENGHYTPTGPDVTGLPVKIRAGDGVHFTEAGARKLAFFTEKLVRKLIETAPAAHDAVSVPLATAQPIDINQQILRELASGRQELPIQVPLPDMLPISIETRPAAGPVLSLTAPPVAADGKLATGAPTIADRNAYADVVDVLLRGRASHPKQGRADDFAWDPGR
jgi:hypothetical protein